MFVGEYFDRVGEVQHKSVSNVLLYKTIENMWSKAIDGLFGKSSGC